MSELATLARPYAAAVFRKAKESAATEKWSQTLRLLSTIVSNEAMSPVLGNPKISKQDLLAVILDLCQEQVDDEGANFLKLLVHNDRMSLLSTIANLYEAYKADDEGYVEVDVYAAYEFSEETRHQFAATLEQALSKKIHMNITLDKSLIGGVLVRAGDKVIDGSIRGQLQQMRKSLQ